jgi:phage N-6-adenine-methyltransferase
MPALTHDQTIDWPVWWFVRLEAAVEKGDHAAANEAQRELARLGVSVRYRRQERSVHFSSRTDQWATPQDLFAKLNDRFGGFTLDPCADASNAKCKRFFTKTEDGLAHPWTGRVFLNPPYGRQIAAWVKKAWESAQTTAEVVVLLLPARTDTRWWHDYCALGDVEFLRGRVRFGGAASGAPFPSAVVVFRNGAATDVSA